MIHAHLPRALPALAPIAGEQLWFLVSSLRRIWPFMILPVATLVFFSKVNGSHPDSRLFVSVLLAMFLTVAAWPQQKTAGGIAYFRSLPPVHWKNASVRTGVIWLILMVVCLTSFLAIDSGYDGTAPFSISGTALVGGTLTLLVLSAVFAATRYGIFWLIGAHWMFNLARRIADFGVAEPFEPLIWGQLGAMVAITGRVRTPSPEGGAPGLSMEFGPWLLASAIWLAVGLAIFLFATTRRREY